MTHKDEIIHLSNVAMSKGASVELHKDDEGRIDTITITGLKGLRDVHKGSLIATMESLRPVVGPDAIKPTVSLENGSPVYGYSEAQLRCYGGIDTLLKSKVYGRSIQEGTKFSSVERMNDGEIKTKYWSNQDGDLIKFDSKDEFDAFKDAPLVQDNDFSY